MNRSSAIWSWLKLALILSSNATVVADESAAVLFEQHIRPVLVAKCVQCHGAKKQEGGLRLDSHAAVLAGGDSGQLLLAGAPQESLLIEALKYESFEMPPQGQLPDETIRHFETWISAGAQWPEHTGALREPTSKITEQDRQWWPFQPVVKRDPPQVENVSWARNAIDRFVLARMEQSGLQPAPAADRTTLLRRLHFTLLGLPPSPEDIARFLNDDSPTAWNDLVDRLLADERYGEHAARGWLDLVRYSESDGWNQDAYRPHMWRYRDYVVKAFNTDKPYPEFVRQQLAGDEMDRDQPEDLIAAGFLRLGIYEYNQRDARGHWNDIMNEMTDVVGDVFLGLSMSCARCHDHKFDPIPQEDYFKLRAFFEPIVWRDDLAAATAAERIEYQRQLEQWEAATADIRKQIEKLLESYHTRKWQSTVDKFPLEIQACFHTPQSQRTSWQAQMAYLVSRQFEEEGGGPLKSIKPDDKRTLEALQAELAKFDALRPAELPAVTTVRDHTGPASPTIIPDDPELRPILPGFLTVMTPAEGSRSAANAAATSGESATDLPTARLVSTSATKTVTTGRRTELARWIGDSRNPLTTRVIVNRVWQQHFGRGLVDTSNDFGRNGSQPSHPELLDWLTAEFIERDWSLKWLHRTLLTSATWRQSAHHPQAEVQQAVDPDERLLWRNRIRRLQAEQIRDAMLTASGELSPEVGGPSVVESTPRRGLYVKSFRNNTDTFLHAFDMANGLQSVPLRDATTTPTQALTLINGEYALSRARAMAKRLSTTSLGLEEQVRQAFLRTWGREPQRNELLSSLQYCAADPSRLVDLCHVLFNANEFLYVE